MTNKQDKLRGINESVGVMTHPDTLVGAPFVVAQRPMTDFTAWASPLSIENFFRSLS